jgi:hypothetical protein
VGSSVVGGAASGAITLIRRAAPNFFEGLVSSISAESTCEAGRLVSPFPPLHASPLHLHTSTRDCASFLRHLSSTLTGEVNCVLRQVVCQIHYDKNALAFKMSPLLPVAVYGLEVPVGGILVPAEIEFPATVRT